LGSEINIRRVESRRVICDLTPDRGLGIVRLAPARWAQKRQGYREAQTERPEGGQPSIQVSHS
jgi:hypothetical protein